MPEQCPKHKVSYRLRRNAQSDEIALACPLCDVEAHAGTEHDVATVAETIAPHKPDEKNSN